MITLKLLSSLKQARITHAIVSLQIQQNTQVLFPKSFHPVYIEDDVNHIHYENQLTQIHLENVDYNLKKSSPIVSGCSIISTLYPTCWATAIALCVNASSFITAPGKCV